MSLQATATGTFEQAPLCQLLLFALERSLGGSLVMETPTGAKGALVLRAGHVFKVRCPDPALRVGELSVALGLLDTDDLTRVVETRRAKLFGEHLHDVGLIDGEALTQVLGEQLLRCVEVVAGYPPETVYGYYADHDVLPASGVISGIDPLAAIGRAFRASPLGAQKVEEVVQRLRSSTLRLHPQARVGRFGFAHRQAAVLDVLRAKPQTYRSLVNTELLPQAELDQVIALLALARHLDVGTGFPLGVEPRATSLTPPARGTSLTPPRVPSSAPAPGSSRSADVGAELEARAAAASGQNYYAVLGVEPTTDASALQAAFLQMARRWHPDKLPAELKPFRPAATKLFARMTEAHQVLSNATSRAEYDRRLAEQGDVERDAGEVERALLAASTFQQAEVAGRKNDWASAARIAAQAFEQDQNQLEYGAFHVYAVVKAGQRSPALIEPLLDVLNRAVKAYPKNVRVRSHRAYVLKQLGRLSEARRDYRAIVEQEPAHVEAQRELRLFRMRHETHSAASGDGLLGKLFKK